MAFLDNKSVVMVAGLVMLVLYVGNGALMTLASLPLVSQALQILGMLYVAELLLDSLGHRVQRFKLRLPAWSPTPTTEPRGQPEDNIMYEGGGDSSDPYDM